MKLTRSDLRALLLDARRQGYEEAQAVSRHHDCREAEATIDEQGRRVVELEARLAAADAPMQPAESRLADSGCAYQAAYNQLHDCRRELERVQGERDRLAGEVDEVRSQARRLSYGLSEDVVRDATLGRLVRAMPVGYDLCRGEKEWYVNAVGGCVGIDYATPTEALRAAGVVAVEPGGVTEGEEGVRS